MLLTGKINNLGKLIQQTWDLKKQLNKSMTNKKIRYMEQKLCKPNLADGCRLLGTGGGGHILFYIKPQNRFNFLKELSKLKINYYKVKLDLEGLKVWEIIYKKNEYYFMWLSLVGCEALNYLLKKKIKFLFILINLGILSLIWRNIAKIKKLDLV